jgi:hypothetical protein
MLLVGVMRDEISLLLLRPPRSGRAIAGQMVVDFVQEGRHICSALHGRCSREGEYGDGEVRGERTRMLKLADDELVTGETEPETSRGRSCVGIGIGIGESGIGIGIGIGDGDGWMVMVRTGAISSRAWRSASSWEKRRYCGGDD